MVLGTSQKVNHHIDIDSVMLSGEIVETVTTFKYLGILLDNHLSFCEHVAYLRRKIYAKVKVLGHVRQYISQIRALQLYKSLILPEFDYADQIYDAMPDGSAQPRSCKSCKTFVYELSWTWIRELLLTTCT